MWNVEADAMRTATHRRRQQPPPASGRPLHVPYLLGWAGLERETWLGKGGWRVRKGHPSYRPVDIKQQAFIINKTRILPPQTLFDSRNKDLPLINLSTIF